SILCFIRPRCISSLNWPIKRFNPHEIEVILLIKRPDPCLLICDREQALEIHDLFQENDYRALLSNIENGIAHFTDSTSNS
ncbi:hypothetical protein V2H45_25180, partial [Tumidithrix elongata RA019]|nr:hypothetical protein [Tumidithrix elongata RA019]